MPGHRVTQEWMGKPVDTLEDLVRPGLRAICVGINPSVVSVEAGHYYQGQAGQRFFARLREVGLIPHAARGCEDDAAYAAGIGFTDIVKRPTRSASDLGPAEFEYGRSRLLETLDANRPKLVVFTFKRTAEALFGRFAGNGFVPHLDLPYGDVFVMPGPYEKAATVEVTMATLAKRLGE